MNINLRERTVIVRSSELNFKTSISFKLSTITLDNDCDCKPPEPWWNGSFTGLCGAVNIAPMLFIVLLEWPESLLQLLGGKILPYRARKLK